MATDSIPGTESGFASWMVNFAEVAATHATELNLSSEQTDALEELAEIYNEALVNWTAKQMAAKGATAVKHTAQQNAEELFRPIARIISANSEIPTELKAKLGLKVTPSPSGPVVPVENLAASAYGNGVHKLVWNRNGNSRNTIFQVQAKVGLDGPWTIVGTTNRIRFEHRDQTPGIPTFYRIVSQRAGRLSSPSNEAAVYGNQESRSLRLAA